MVAYPSDILFFGFIIIIVVLFDSVDDILIALKIGASQPCTTSPPHLHCKLRMKLSNTGSFNINPRKETHSQVPQIQYGRNIVHWVTRCGNFCTKTLLCTLPIWQKIIEGKANVCPYQVQMSMWLFGTELGRALCGLCFS